MTPHERQMRIFKRERQHDEEILKELRELPAEQQHGADQVYELVQNLNKLFGRCLLGHLRFEYRSADKDFGGPDATLEIINQELGEILDERKGVK